MPIQAHLLILCCLWPAKAGRVNVANSCQVFKNALKTISSRHSARIQNAAPKATHATANPLEKHHSKTEYFHLCTTSEHLFRQDDGPI